MREKLIHSFYASLEWRAIAFVVTNLFFWVQTGSLAKATGLALLLQIILFTIQILWHFVRYEHGFEGVHSKPDLRNVGYTEDR